MQLHLFGSVNKQSCEIGSTLPDKMLILVWYAKYERGEIGPYLFKNEGVIDESYKKRLLCVCLHWIREYSADRRFRQDDSLHDSVSYMRHHSFERIGSRWIVEDGLAP